MLDDYKALFFRLINNRLLRTYRNGLLRLALNCKISRLVLLYRVTRFHIGRALFRVLNLVADIGFFDVLPRLQSPVANCYLCGMSKNTQGSYINTLTAAADPTHSSSYQLYALENNLFDTYRYEACSRPPANGGKTKPTSLSAFLSILLSLM